MKTICIKIFKYSLLVSTIYATLKQFTAFVWVQAIELDEHQSGLATDFSIRILDSFLQINLDLLRELIEDVLGVEKQKQQNILGAVYSNLGMAVQSLFEHIFDHPVKSYGNGCEN